MDRDQDVLLHTVESNAVVEVLPVVGGEINFDGFKVPGSNGALFVAFEVKERSRALQNVKPLSLL